MKVEIPEEIEEILEKKVTKQANVGRVYLPKEWIGRTVKIILIKEKGD